MNGGVVGEQLLVFLQLGVGNGDGGDQALGIGVHGVVEQLLRLSHLHDIALVDNADAVRDEPDNGQVVGDEQIGGALLPLELFQQVQHLGTNGNVQCGNGLVGNHQLRLHDHSTGQADSLALAAGELVGVPGQVLRQQAHLVDHLLHLLHAVRLILVQVEVVKAFGDDVVHGGALVQRRCGILEDHLDIPDDLPVQGVRNLAGNADTLVEDLTGGAGVDPDDGAANGGLAGTGLAHQGEGLALVNIKRRIPDGLESLVALAELNVHIADGQQDLLAGLLVNGAMLREMPGSCIHLCCFITHSSMTSFQMLNASTSFS